MQVADDLGIGLSSLTRWKRQYRETDLLAGPHEDTAKELARLRKENEVLRQKREILKRAAALKGARHCSSMSGKGNCFDRTTEGATGSSPVARAMVETVFKTIKNELVWRTIFQTRTAAELALGRYIDGFYNPCRRHSALGYKSPVSFEAEMAITE